MCHGIKRRQILFLSELLSCSLPKNITSIIEITSTNNLHVSKPGVTCPSNTSFPPYHRTKAIAPCDNTPIIPSNPPTGYTQIESSYTFILICL